MASAQQKILKRIHLLIRDIEWNGNDGLGRPEPLRGDLADYWSRRIDEANRLVYRVIENRIETLQCRSHYGDK